MDKRFEELLNRMVAPGKFPQISASEGHEVVDCAYALQEKYDKLLTGVKQLLSNVCTEIDKYPKLLNTRNEEMRDALKSILREQEDKEDE